MQQRIWRNIGFFFHFFAFLLFHRAFSMRMYKETHERMYIRLSSCNANSLSPCRACIQSYWCRCKWRLKARFNECARRFRQQLDPFLVNPGLALLLTPVQELKVINDNQDAQYLFLFVCLSVCLSVSLLLFLSLSLSLWSSLDLPCLRLYTW